jgi:hypothetical protein
VAILFDGYRGSFAEVKRPGPEGNRSLPCSVEVKIEFSCTSVRLICFHGLERENFTFN